MRVFYLKEQDIIEINKRLIDKYSPKEETRLVDPASLNMIVNLPMLNVFGEERFPSVFDKATVMFVQLVKKHCFANANKRTASFVLLQFLYINGYQVMAGIEELADFTVKVAVQPLTDENLKRWTKWIEENSRKRQ